MTSLRIRRPSQQGFLAWPAASSMIFLLSAAVLLGGMWGVLAPGMDDEERIGERIAAVGVLHLYLLALLAVGTLLCRWLAGNPDAIGIAVLSACFAIGTAAGLDTIASERPLLTLVLGIAALPLLTVGGWWLGRRMLGRIERSLAAAAVILMSWHALAPGWLGWSFNANIADAARRDPRGEWLSGVWLSAVVCAALLPFAARFTPASDRDQPFLRRAGMRWVLILVLITAGILHLLLLDHAFTLEYGIAACLMPLTLAVLVGNELRQRTWGDAPAWDIAALGVPVVAAVIVTISDGTAPVVWWDVVIAPVAVPLVVAVVALALGRTRGRMIDLGCGALVAAVLMWKGGPGWAELNWNAFLFAAAGLFVALAWRRRRSEFALGAVIVGCYAVVMVPDIMLRLMLWQLAPAAVLALGAGVGVLALGAWLSLSRNADRTAAWSFAVGVYHCCLREPSLLYAPVSGTSLVAGVLILTALARRDPILLTPLVVPVAMGIMRVRLAWIGVASAFTLLATGAWLSWWRIHRPQPSLAPSGEDAEVRNAE